MNLNQFEIVYKSPRMSQDHPHCEAWGSYGAHTHTHTHTLMQLKTHYTHTHTHTLLHHHHYIFFLPVFSSAVSRMQGGPHSPSLYLSLSPSLLSSVSPPLRYSWPHLGQFNELMPVNYSLRCGWPTKLRSPLFFFFFFLLSLFIANSASLSLSLPLSPSPLINGRKRIRGRERGAISIYCHHQHYWCLAALKLGERKGWGVCVLVCVSVCVLGCRDRRLLHH